MAPSLLPVVLSISLGVSQWMEWLKPPPWSPAVCWRAPKVFWLVFGAVVPIPFKAFLAFLRSLTNF
jgi:hypothetical protein